MSLVKLNVKKGDTVLVLSGKDKGKQGKVIAAMPKKGKVVVEGVNKVKRHTKPNQKAPQGGILVKEDDESVDGGTYRMPEGNARCSQGSQWQDGPRLQEVRRSHRPDEIITKGGA